MELLFVCAGNICRSPLAEAFARREFARRGIDVAIAGSAGLIASPGESPRETTIRAGRRGGVDVSAHRARRFDEVMIGDSTLVLVMEERQRAEVIARGVAAGRVRLLGDSEIADPEDGDDEVFDRCVEAIRAGVEAVAAGLENRSRDRSAPREVEGGKSK